VPDTTTSDLFDDGVERWFPEDEYVPEEPFTPPIELVTSEEVRSTLRHVLASCHLRAASELTGLVAQIKASPNLVTTMTPGLQLVYAGVFEALVFEAANLTPTAQIDLGDVAAIANHAPAAQAELEAIHQLSVTGAAAKYPTARIAALAERIQALASRASLEKVISAIDQSSPAEVKMSAFKRLLPPSTQVAVVREVGIETALDLVGEINNTDLPRFSSGYRTLDLAFTGENEPLGFISLGEQTVIAGATGTGKSSVQYALQKAVAQDEINQGFLDNPVILAHTEEESRVKAKAMGLRQGQRFHHLAYKMVIKNIGSSRRGLTELVYRLVVNAMTRSQNESRPITDFLPRIGFLDYIQALTEPGEDLNRANITSAELVLRGLQAFNPEEMAKFSGVDFRTYTGMAWPEGIEEHRMAWVVFAQLRKSSDSQAEWYKKGGRLQLSDFSLEDTSDDPGWVDPVGGGSYAWEVRENDYRLFRQEQIYGSSITLNNATNIVLLHRSRPRGNKAVKGPDGTVHLEDLRGRLIPDKARNGIRMTFAPMAFDIQPPDPGEPEGFRAQYYDLRAERMIEEGTIIPHESYRISGDPILPRRPAASPLAGVRY
jgi:hypothetical protein